MIMAIAADPRQSCLPPSLFPLPKVMYIIKISREDLPQRKARIGYSPSWTGPDQATADIIQPK
jgi:hypothetical protein